MKHNKLAMPFLSLVALIVLLSTANGVNAQERPERPMFSKEQVEESRRAAQGNPNLVLGCTGQITQVIDLGYENLKFTSAVFGTNPGGGEGGQFDKTPVLSTTVTLKKETCLNAHLSAIVGSKQTYGVFLPVSNLTLFQVTLTPASGGGPRHMVGSLWYSQSGCRIGGRARCRYVRFKLFSKSRQGLTRSTPWNIQG